MPSLRVFAGVISLLLLGHAPGVLAARQKPKQRGLVSVSPVLRRLDDLNALKKEILDLKSPRSRDLYNVDLSPDEPGKMKIREAGGSVYIATLKFADTMGRFLKRRWTLEMDPSATDVKAM